MQKRCDLSARAVAALLSAIAIAATSQYSLALEPAQPIPSDDFQRWLSNHAVAVRSIAATDDDFSDLEPLIDAIGSARVVQLGEPAHGAGSSFAAKVRLIKFLHQRMGFDVLAWESGLHGMRAVDAGFRDRGDPIAAAERGIFTIWSTAEEVKPLLEYASTMQGTRPLHMAGFDMQFTARHSREYFESDLRSFVGALRDRIIRERSQKLVEQALGAYWQICCALAEARARKAAELSDSGTPKDRLEQAMAQWMESEGSKLRATQKQLTVLQEATSHLLMTIDSNRTAFEQVHGSREIGFMVNAVSNLAAGGAGKFDLADAPGATTATFSNRDRYFARREERNARNLRWLVEEGYPGRKIIVWAHNIHVMDAYVEPGFQGIRVQPRPGDLKPTGSYVADWLDDQVYTIGMTTYEGDDRWVTGSKLSHITPPASISLEARLHALGKPYLFLDMRSLDGDNAHPLRKPQSLRLPAPVSDAAGNPSGYGISQVSDVTRIYDAILYIDVMAPATRIEAAKEDR